MRVEHVNTFRGMALHGACYVFSMHRKLLIDLANRIRDAREGAKLTQTDLAAACNWKNGSRLGNYEQGTREPTLSDLSAIAEATGVRYAWLVTGSLPRNEERRVAEPRGEYDAGGFVAMKLSHEDAAQLEVIRALSPAMRAHIKALSDALVKPSEGTEAAS